MNINTRSLRLIIGAVITTLVVVAFLVGHSTTPAKPAHCVDKLIPTVPGQPPITVCI